MTAASEIVCPARLATFVQALRQAFGDRALEVAGTQQALAEGDSAAVWQIVVDALQR